VLELFMKAGWSAIPLGVCSVLALAIILERLYVLGRLGALERRAYHTLRTQRGAMASFDPALSTAPCAEVMDSLTELRGADRDVLQQAAEIALSMQRFRLRRYLAVLATIGSIAPFIGLFGTVLGVMAAFQGMSQAGLSGEGMAAGISEALSATALGLLVAIPSVVAYNYFLGRVQGMLLEIQNHVARLTAGLQPAPREMAEGARAR